jgi:hypothetical protein
MAVPLPAVLADQVGAGLAGVAVRLWPQIMASAREHLVPWIDRNAPDLAAPVRLAFHDLDIVADELRQAVRGAWQRLRVLLIGQTAQLVGADDGGWAIRITSRLRDPAHAGAGPPVIELMTEDGLCWESLPAGIRAAALNGFRGASIDIVRIRDDLLSLP